MKKLYTLVAAFMLVGGIVFTVSAGGQYNWGTSTGANWGTPDDTTIQLGQALVVTSSVPFPSVGTSSTTALGLGSFTLAQLNAATPRFLGQIAYCSNCTNTMLVVSTGVSTAGSWASVYIATGSGGTSLSPAK
jgi:hypothetical protein